LFLAARGLARDLQRVFERVQGSIFAHRLLLNAEIRPALPVGQLAKFLHLCESAVCTLLRPRGHLVRARAWTATRADRRARRGDSRQRAFAALQREVGPAASDSTRAANCVTLAKRLLPLHAPARLCLDPLGLRRSCAARSS